MRLDGSIPFDEVDRRLAEEIGRRTAVAIDNARLHRSRAEVAMTLQATLLPPELPDVPGADIAAEYHPSGDGVEVGGDFYDVFSLSEDRWVLMIGDVCGTGPAAAALTSQIRHGARVAARAGLRPAAVVPAINASLIDTIQAGRFCTMVYAELVSRPSGLVLQVICAGHPPPIVIRDGYAQELPVRGPLLGIIPFARFSPMETTIRPGEVMVLVTDGAIEAREAEPTSGDRRAFYGQDRLASVIEEHASDSACNIARSIAQSVVEFGGGRLADDLAILVLRAKDTGLR
jgi:serine phosphatase RsbU (regulator of sigma subunit)